MTYHNLYHKMWVDKNGTFRKIIDQHGRDAAFLAMYLVTNPYAEQSGIYHCPLSHMALHTGMTVDQIDNHLQTLNELGFCKYDHDADVVWVMRMVKYQVPDFPSGLDNKVKGVINKLSTVPSSCLVDEFRRYWKLGEGASEALKTKR